MAITEQQLNMVMSQSVDQIKKYISQGLIKFPDDLLKYKDNPKFRAIESELSSMPAPDAVAAWNEIESIPADDTATLSHLLSGFIANHSAYPGNKTMVDKARYRLSSLTAGIEQSDWNAVDTSSITSLLSLSVLLHSVWKR